MFIVCRFPTSENKNSEVCVQMTKVIFDKYLQYTPSVSTIILSGPTYSSQNVRQIWESTLSKSDYLVGRESGY